MVRSGVCCACIVIWGSLLLQAAADPGRDSVAPFSREPTSLSSPTMLVIYDGSDPGGYDPYLDISMVDGNVRKMVVNKTHPAYAVDAQSIKSALLIIDSLSIPAGSLDRIAIVDHGDVKQKLPVQTLGERGLKPKDFKGLGRYLKPDGDLCLYGCQVGKNVRYLKRISDSIGGRRVWAYAGVLSQNPADPLPLPDPDRSLFFYSPMKY